jgi:uncharacterized membrane protein
MNQSLLIPGLKSRFSRYDICVLAGIVVYCIILSVVSLYRYRYFFADIDLAIFNQSFWTTIHNGGILENTLEFKDGSHLGIHFSPLLLILLPVYYLFQGPETLIVSQTVLLSLGAIPLYLLGREKLGDRAGCGIALLYLLNPALHGINLYDFHEVAFLPFLLGMGIWGLVTRRDTCCLFFCLLSLLVKEDVTLIVTMIGVVGLYQSRSEPIMHRWQYLILSILPAVLLCTYINVMKGLIFGEGISDGSQAFSQYSTIIDNLSMNNDVRLTYLLLLLIPLAALPVFTPEVLVLALPSLCEILLSPNSFYYQISSHHSAPLIPVLFCATILSLEKISRMTYPTRFCLSTSRILVVLFLLTVVTSAFVSPAAHEIRFMTTEHPGLEDHLNLLYSVIEEIPDDVSVSTQNNLASQLSGRADIRHTYTRDSDVIIYDTSYPQSKLFTSQKTEIENTHQHIPVEQGIFVFIKRANQTE